MNLITGGNVQTVRRYYTNLYTGKQIFSANKTFPEDLYFDFIPIGMSVGICS